PGFVREGDDARRPGFRVLPGLAQQVSDHVHVAPPMHRQGLGIALAKHFLRDGAGQDVAEPLFPIPFLAIEPGYAQSTPVLNQVDRLHPEALAQTDAYMASLLHGPGEIVAVDLLVLAV